VSTARPATRPAAAFRTRPERARNPSRSVTGSVRDRLSHFSSRPTAHLRSLQIYLAKQRPYHPGRRLNAAPVDAARRRARGGSGAFRLTRGASCRGTPHGSRIAPRWPPSLRALGARHGARRPARTSRMSPFLSAGLCGSLSPRHGFGAERNDTTWLMSFELPAEAQHVLGRPRSY